MTLYRRVFIPPAVAHERGAARSSAFVLRRGMP